VGPWLWVTSIPFLCTHSVAPLQGQMVLEVGGARSVIRSYCNNKNWKMVFQIPDKNDSTSGEKD